MNRVRAVKAMTGGGRASNETRCWWEVEELVNVVVERKEWRVGKGE